MRQAVRVIAISDFGREGREMLAKQSTIIFNQQILAWVATRRAGRRSRGVGPRTGIRYWRYIQGRMVREVTPRVNSRYICDKSRAWLGANYDQSKTEKVRRRWMLALASPANWEGVSEFYILRSSRTNTLQWEWKSKEVLVNQEYRQGSSKRKEGRLGNVPRRPPAYSSLR